jgi:5-oxoprolinase (ATP-hydrolysing)
MLQKKRFQLVMPMPKDAIFVSMQEKWKINIDTGGTFTDCIAHSPEGEVVRVKVLSSSRLRAIVLAVSPTAQKLKIEANWHKYPGLFIGYHIIGHDNQEIAKIADHDPQSGWIEADRPIEGIEAGATLAFTTWEEAPILAARLATQTACSKDLPPLDMRLGSTKGTNALLERKGASTLLIITQGFADLLHIGTQQRPDLFALHIQKPQALMLEVLEVEERLDADGKIIKPISKTEIDRILTEVSKSKCESIAISCMHAYRNPIHEQELAEALQKAFPQKYISTSSQISPSIKFVERTATVVANAYLAPILERYLSAVQAKLAGGSLKVMSSAGSLVAAGYFHPKDSLLSGPAGGVVGASVKAQNLQVDHILTLDMGGTSTDVARYDGNYDYRFETKVGDAILLSPSLAIETVAAGGGSICGYDGFKLFVGPESAGAQPGPACYGVGGPLTVTDLNLLSGRLAPDAFGIPLDVKAAEAALRTISEASGQSPEILLEGFQTIANEKMADAIRAISVRKGYDPKAYALLAFGGAGGQHACRVAELLGIGKVIIPGDAGLLSAFGMGEARIERFASRQILRPLEACQDSLAADFDALAKDASIKLQQEGFSPEEIQVNRKRIFLRFTGQDHSIEVPWENGNEVVAAFREKYENLYGHWLEGKTLEVESIKVWASDIARQDNTTVPPTKAYCPKPDRQHVALFHGKWEDIPIFQMEELKVGAEIEGPAIILSKDSTTVVEPGWTFELFERGSSVMRKGEGLTNKEQGIGIFEGKKTKNYEPGTRNQELSSNPIELELFTNRFRAIAEEMGALLLRTAFSVNVKERMDFSCALLDAHGELVANAPHIPVHLGSLGMCVRKVREVIEIAEGDVIITNHPNYGGSHLPDISLIRGVFYEGECVGYVANRAHHAEVGGSRPGSMPPDAASLAEEGVVIAPMYLIRGGESRWEDIHRLLRAGNWPSRNPAENEADLRAGLASLLAGEQALLKLCQQESPVVVQRYMDALKVYVGDRFKTRFTKLQKFSKPGFKQTSEQELLDDGTALAVSIRYEEPKLVFDFTGTSPVHSGNLNATPAIVNSAVLYVLRLLLDEDLPLNEGLMRDIQIILPKGILNPPFPDDPKQCPAVVGGNTETSQRLVDTLLKAFKMAACSQGTMNNLLFGNAHFGYYETICGGTGAGPDFDGASAVHQHMTNTRITDPEIIELRYPVRLDEFSIRKDSGGQGRQKGGNGIVRKLTFLEPVSLTLLSQHREVPPYGMEGGEPGKTGRQYLVRANGLMLPLPGIAKVEIEAGDAVWMETPGGGGWGE